MLGLSLTMLFYRHPRTSFPLGMRNPFVRRAFVDVLSDRADYLQVILRLFGSLPLYLLFGCPRSPIEPHSFSDPSAPIQPRLRKIIDTDRKRCVNGCPYRDARNMSPI